MRPIKSTGSPVRPAETPETSKKEKSRAAPAAKKPAPAFEAKARAKANLDPAPATQAPVKASPSALPYVHENGTLLDELAGSGKLSLAITTELAQRILGEVSVNTRNRPQEVALPRKRADLVAVDAQMQKLLGPALWSELKAASDATAQRCDDVANEQKLPPEGIHPDFAIAAKGLLKKTSGAKVSGAEVAASDEALAKTLKTASSGAVATVLVFLDQFGVGSDLAPKTFAALDSLQRPLSSDTLQRLSAVRGPASPAADASLAELVSDLSPEQLLLAQHALAGMGAIDDRLTFYGWVPTQQLSERFPKLVAAMEARDVRAELLEPVLKHDASYQGHAGFEAGLMRDAIYQARQATGSGPLEQFARTHLGDTGDLIDWALLQDQKLRFLNSEATPTPKEVPLAERSIEQTFFDHLRARREGDLEKDLRLNYDPDLVFTENQGNFFGHEGVRHSAKVLGELVPGREWVMNRLTFTPTGPTQGYATEIWSADAKGKLVTAVDNFFIKDGKILMQSAYYTDVRSDLARGGSVHSHDAAPASA